MSGCSDRERLQAAHQGVVSFSRSVIPNSTPLGGYVLPLKGKSTQACPGSGELGRFLNPSGLYTAAEKCVCPEDAVGDINASSVNFTGNLRLVSSATAGYLRMSTL